MKEDFLYHLWKFQKYDSEDLKTSEKDYLKIFKPGIQNELSGPDFFNAKIQIGDQLWAGNVEIHIKSSDWYLHRHEIDSNYDNVILHVVWEHDEEIYRRDNSIIPTLVLKDKVDKGLQESYENLLEKDHLKLNCENDFKNFSDFQMEHWLERLFFERLERKTKFILDLLAKTGNNWEAVLFTVLSRSFGSKVNADAFMIMAQSLDFKVVQKLSNNRYSLEALFLGQAKLIKGEDQYSLELQKEYDYLKHKFSLKNEFLPSPEFFRLRPDNFPSIRLAQLAALYSEKKNIFHELMQAKNITEIKDLFDLQISEYWKSHYNFGKTHTTKNKKLTSAFIDIIIINCIVPIKHCYFQFIGEENEQSIQDLIQSIKTEKNSVVNLYNELRPKTATTAMHSQALLQLNSEYCTSNKCLQCELGASLLRKSPKYI
ncbi:DUF2851 family protein [Christiangramia forsetii]|uniref:DUF2851 domain-containing protein n=2 Tax=Christiangramia forsetii TaxID=411153 RepID=A0M408_CHRFK|nr:DUF2851 family protein [Christiangramia forsetii]GGG24535.1 hypothetical protein GCM10011532_04750 [Christiangramia forsetii]CAL67353.1 conserved hypothetical protein [Christiangramia forsetii KT0803]